MAQKLELLKFDLNYRMVAMFGRASYYFINYEKLSLFEKICLGAIFSLCVIGAYFLTKMYLRRINE